MQSLREHRFSSRSLLAIISLITGFQLCLSFAGCRYDAPDREIVVSGSPSFLPADSDSCITLSIDYSGHAYATAAPTIKASLGDLGPLRQTMKGWEASLCPDGQTGLIEFSSPVLDVARTRELWFLPPEGDPGPYAVTSFVAHVDPVGKTVTLSISDVDDGLSIGMDVLLNPGDPFFFNGSTVVFMPVVIGSDLPGDASEIYVVAEGISAPGVAVLNGDTWAWGGGRSFFYGGFLDTERSLSQEGSPAYWGEQVEAGPLGTAAFDISFTVYVILPSPVEDHAELTIGPYLTNLGPDSVVVSWETDRETWPLAEFGSTVGCTRLAIGQTERLRLYDDYDFSFPRLLNSNFHRAVLTGLKPGRRYYYRPVVPGTDRPALSFKTPVPADKEFTFGVIGDTQKDHDTHTQVFGLMASHSPDFYLHVGDLVDFGASFQQWLDFHRIESVLYGSVPIFPAVGNHDMPGYDSFYFRYFRQEPKTAFGDTLFGHAYSFDYGNSHFISLDTNLSVDPDSAQYKWLEADLASASANSKIKFIFVFHHFPIYCANSYIDYVEGKAYLAPLYEQYGVDAVFSGHVHLYQRDDVGGRVYIIAGGGGGGLIEAGPSLAIDPYYVVYERTHNFLTVDVGADYFSIVAYDDSGNSIDQVYKSKP